MKSFTAKKEEVERKWVLVDAQEAVLGRMASKIAPILMGKTRPTYTPQVDTGDFVIVINAGKIKVTGCKADDIDISVHGNTLTISGEKKQEEQKEGKGYYHIERSYGGFRRDLNLATGVDPEKIEATCKDGVITITVPKTEKERPVKVKVKER